MKPTRTSSSRDVSDEEWDLLLPYFTLMREDAPQRDYPLRMHFNAIRSVVKTDCQWRFLLNDLPLWTAVHQQAGVGWRPMCTKRSNTICASARFIVFTTVSRSGRVLQRMSNVLPRLRGSLELLDGLIAMLRR